MRSYVFNVPAFIVLMLLIVTNVTAQDGLSDLKVHAGSLSLGTALIDGDGGISGSVDLDLAYKEHIFKLMVMGTVVSGGFAFDSRDNLELNFLYGRESLVKLGESSYLDAFAGLGYLRYEVEDFSANRSRYVETLGFPILSRIRFQTGERLGLGIQGHGNVNSGDAIFTLGFFLQYRL